MSEKLKNNVPHIINLLTRYKSFLVAYRKLSLIKAAIMQGVSTNHSQGKLVQRRNHNTWRDMNLKESCDVIKIG